MTNEELIEFIKSEIYCTLCEKGKIAEGTANLIGNFTWIACPCCDGNWKNCRTCQERGD